MSFHKILLKDERPSSSHHSFKRAADLDSTGMIIISVTSTFIYRRFVVRTTDFVVVIIIVISVITETVVECNCEVDEEDDGCGDHASDGESAGAVPQLASTFSHPRLVRNFVRTLVN